MLFRSKFRSLWGVPAQVAEHLEEKQIPVLTAWDLFRLIKTFYLVREANVPPPRNIHKIYATLEKNNIVTFDRDYKSHFRVLIVSDQPAEDIVCLIDQFCHISHLSAMQKWRLTDRQPLELIITRPDNKTVSNKIRNIMEREIKDIPWDFRPSNPQIGPFKLGNISHPKYVRRRLIKIRKSRNSGVSIKGRNGFVRVSTIGQTFLDMLMNPDLCGGMAHVLEIWDEHAIKYLDSIIQSIETASSIVKCRAGYIIQERLDVDDVRVNTWRACAQRGGSRVLDPQKPYIPEWSEDWKISLNA